MWLRLARAYAGDTHGLHLPLLAGTEVAIAFEQGDPDRPYIAHALHDNQHPDPSPWPTTTRNVLRPGQQQAAWKTGAARSTSSSAPSTAARAS
jgi:uncharacterized protein involved in type VI secretion and phage assembly